MKKMAAGAFKPHCLAVMDDVQATHETVVITKKGKPEAKRVPVEPQGDDIFRFTSREVTITGDVVSPHCRGANGAISRDFARHARCALADYGPRQSIRSRPNRPSRMPARMGTAWQFQTSLSWSWRHSRVRAASTSVSPSTPSCGKSRPDLSSNRSVVVRVRAPWDFQQLIPKIQQIALSEPPRWSRGLL